MTTRTLTSDSDSDAPAEWPSVTLVYLSYNRRAELAESLRRMLRDSDYESGRVDVIVVDNASTDGSQAMLREEFPQVKLIERDENIGVSAWNEGFAVATGDYVLALDDDCYLPPGGLRQAVAAAREHAADLVSFRVVSTYDPEHDFTEKYRTGLFLFWGCAVLIRREVLAAIGGYDPEIFVWANELEFMLRFYDRGFRHLHYPPVVAQHMKEVKPLVQTESWIAERPYRINARHWGYIAAKLLSPRDAAETLVALLAKAARDGLRVDRVALRALPETLRGFAHGLRHRDPVSNRELSRFYRRNFETFASPWWVSRPLGELIRSVPRELLSREPLTRLEEDGAGRRDEYYAERARWYPQEPATLDFRA